MAETESLVTLKRGLSILKALGAASSTRGVDHTSLARELDFRRSTLYRYLACLEGDGFVESADVPGRYRLGPAITCLAAVVHSRKFSDFARDFLRDLASLTGETTYATVYDYPYTVTVFVADGTGPVGPRVPLGSRRPLHASASGKAYLAYERPRVVTAYLSGPLGALTSRTLTRRESLRAALLDVRRHGYALDQGESYDGICGIAAPVFDHAGQVVGTLSVVVATAKLEAHQISRLADPLLVSADGLSARLGHVNQASLSAHTTRSLPTCASNAPTPSG